ncbi:MAG TPA: protein phosphatase 2C domain-containing protein [Leptolyngbyaceae cyanobacterium]
MGDAAKITCPNQLCQAPNPEAHRFCQRCRTPLPKRYLWAVGAGIEGYKPGKLLGDRYLVKRDRILLDTKPGFTPLFPTDIPDALLPYLRLFSYQLHVPQVYGKLPPLKKNQNQEIWLLEQAPIFSDRKDEAPVLLPKLTALWKNSSTIRQLNWLWQIAHLWQPFSYLGVASSLLEPKLLRVEGSLVRLLELSFDREELTLKDLGLFWRELVNDTKPEIADFLAELCQQTIRQQISIDEVIAQMDRILGEVARSQTRTYQIATLTDTGPTRQRNEDACYPPSGSFNQIPIDSQVLAVVCDGIGGHEGGNVASNLAIETVVSQISQYVEAEVSHFQPINQLESAVCDANDRISERNDREGRFDRQRMGTTLVMALTNNHEMYVTHIGDSRVYWITSTGCHQVTLDDDVASREVRLGYTLYREALQQLGSGSLVQALGMSSSNNLHPTVQKLIIDEDSIFLLCSDGLSDNDRVEQFWDTEILPVLAGKIDLATAAAKLIEIANTQNGHDNVTIGLIYCQVKEPETADRKKKSQTAKISLGLPSYPITELPSENSPSSLKTQLLSSPRRTPRLLPLLLGIALLLGVGAMLLYFLVGKWGESTVLSTVEPEIKPNTPTIASPVPTKSSDSLLPTGATIRIENGLAKNSQGKIVQLLLYPAPHQPSDKPPAPIGIIPGQTLLEVKTQVVLGQNRWLKLKVCTATEQEPNGKQLRSTNNSSSNNPPSSASAINFVKASQEGWVKQTDLELHIQQNGLQQPADSAKCKVPSPPATPTAN